MGTSRTLKWSLHVVFTELQCHRSIEDIPRNLMLIHKFKVLNPIQIAITTMTSFVKPYPTLNFNYLFAYFSIVIVFYTTFQKPYIFDCFLLPCLTLLVFQRNDHF